jgi:ferredoxin
MAYLIVAKNCTSCSACEPECPNDAISEQGSSFVIDAAKCTECIGFHDEPQCVAACPIDRTCIINPDYPRYQAKA